MHKLSLLITILAWSFATSAQITWKNVDHLFQPLPKSVHVYFTDDSLDGKPNIAYYVEARLKDKSLEFTTDTTFKGRLTPSGFYDKNNRPLIVVNGTFFSFETNRNLNVVMKDKRLVSYNSKTYKSPADTTRRLQIFSSAIGINRKRKADVAWIKTDSVANEVWASQKPNPERGNYFARSSSGQTISYPAKDFDKWKMTT